MNTGNKMKKVVYSIGPNKKNSYSLHLWREEKSNLCRVATFANHTVAELFAKEFDFPLSEDVKKILNTAQVSGMGS